MKKKISITSLAMRFHEHFGWSEPILNAYLLSGSFKKMAGWPEMGVSDYYILDVGSRLDIDRLIKDDHVGELIGRDSYGELRGLTDQQVLESRNW